MNNDSKTKKTLAIIKMNNNQQDYKSLSIIALIILINSLIIPFVFTVISYFDNQSKNCTQVEVCQKE